MLGKALLSPQVSRGVASGDYDNDGDIDVLVNNCGGPPQLLRNDGGNRNHSITIELRGHRSNRSGVGALIEVFSHGKRRVFQALGGGSHMSASDPRIHVGLGETEIVDEIRIRWPSGLVDRVARVKAGQRILGEEGQSAGARR